MSGPQVVTPAVLRDWPLAEPGSSKDSSGELLVLGGSASTPGALRLAGEAALRAGAGKLAMATVASTAASLGVAVPEAQVVGLPEDGDGSLAPAAADLAVDRAASTGAVLAGPGLMDPEHASSLLASVLPRLEVAVVLDALGTCYLTDHPEGLHHLDGRAVVTANPVEVARMSGREELADDDELLEAAVGLAARCRAVVLAGAATKYVAAPDGRTWAIAGGGPGLGVSGSGDVQAGIVAGLLVRGEEPVKAAVWGAHVHARAGEQLAGRVGQVGYLARELPEAVSAVLLALR
ncbi:NAD(P)H-hydrate dehydratase [Nocardioides sp. zg-DK7169]|uniref:NAD(P)H-hydrate dehydratase n=1 Tax=Nocardioides sp. zg-DK7169 TaxID=2736600 RepID=UPI0015561A74|nr:NAD(P)H-hydrate dehydratase [Nocardioides sp. zg-DK7169]NPC96811.1 NAD(P)H-hydrate dehydratase [Nocardioides sp. zg-DK7169]